MLELPPGWKLSPSENLDNYTGDMTRTDVLPGIPCLVIVNQSDENYPIGLAIQYPQMRLKVLARV